ncbi:Cro protein [Gordonia phage Clark]|uniref:Cro protein n=7 Tax=Beenievirus TaxID=3044673 RepID=A0A5P8DAX7_9CAUD|nr:helix-turn-helix DNA-binding protein [Gordonia phage Beenie]YP_010654133.1 Cro protein [Gordonia phage Sekhmet]YP_010654287.1 helix-turn-helix DNA binding protein [Gordonia phage Dorito]YP_010654359.1 Cro protein [Gordonia phage DobbysSock]YP_010654439.1 Cro protein [Gordonia phage Clark]YP_010654518.1 Cro protein [Gordonia phage Samman98]YP_010654597.1 helix-turn-helix DNA binding domain protein [Gordonia phage MichaelScott]WNM74305.1 Cro protein [Gordonia phage Thimann]AUV61603.1 helix
MESRSAAKRRYARQRDRKTPPHISLKAHRLSLDPTPTLDDIADRVEAITGDRPTKGALSAIESGLRGISSELLDALNEAYGFPSGTITTDYAPRSAAVDVPA